MANRLIPLGWAATLLLLACTRETTVAVARAGDRVAIAVTRGDRPPCIQGLVVTVAGADIDATPPLWELATAEPARCLARFHYGEVPRGYSQSGQAPRLLVGSRYMVEVSGPGLQGGAEFTMRADDGPMTAETAP